MAFQQFNISPWLTPVRLASTSNQSGTYFNGALNNGVGATSVPRCGGAEHTCGKEKAEGGALGYGDT